MVDGVRVLVDQGAELTVERGSPHGGATVVSAEREHDGSSLGASPRTRRVGGDTRLRDPAVTARLAPCVIWIWARGCWWRSTVTVTSPAPPARGHGGWLPPAGRSSLRARPWVRTGCARGSPQGRWELTPTSCPQRCNGSSTSPPGSVPAGPLVVVGFSQGGAVALEVAARSDEVAGVVSVCGFMAHDDDAEVLRTFPGRAPVLVVGGVHDESVPSFMSSDAAAVVAAHGRPVQIDLVDSGHEVGDEAVAVIRDWLARSLTGGPRVSLGLPVERVSAGVELLGATALGDLARAYERFGFHAAYVTDHPAPDDRWLAHGGHHSLEPTVALAVAAAATRHLLVHTNVYVLGYRNPFLAAKAIASLDVVSEGRLVLGVAAGYLRPSSMRSVPTSNDGAPAWTSRSSCSAASGPSTRCRPTATASGPRR